MANFHGELPCPACGYQRRGLAHEKACPECGARGFAGEMIISGTPVNSAESKLGDRLYNLTYLVIGINVLLLTLWGTGRRSFEPTFTRIRAICFIAMGALFLAGWLRRRHQKRSGLSLERCVWEFDADTVTVRHNASEVRIPYRDIREVSAQIDFVKRRTRVTLVTSGESLRLAGLPDLFLHGSLAEQRAIVSEIKRNTQR